MDFLKLKGPYKISVVGTLQTTWRNTLREGPFVADYEKAEGDCSGLYERLVKLEPELILVAEDLRRPGLESVLSRLRYHPHTSDRPILIVADGKPNRETMQVMVRSGISFLLTSLSIEEFSVELVARCRDARAARWRTLKEMSGAMAHSLNQPLAAMLGSCEILSEVRPPLREGIKETLDVIQRNANEVERIIVKLDEIQRYETTSYPGDGGDIIDLNKSAEP